LVSGLASSRLLRCSRATASKVLVWLVVKAIALWVLPPLLKNLSGAATTKVKLCKMWSDPASAVENTVKAVENVFGAA
jgi:hypothetical protein